MGAIPGMTRKFRAQFDAVLEAGAKLRHERRTHERAWARREHTYSDLVQTSVAIDERIRQINTATEPPEVS